MANQTITIESTINAPVEKVWKLWTEPEHIQQWCNASDDWHAPHAENDVRTGGQFLTRMEAKDGSFGFDFGGVYDEVVTNERLAYTMSDDRKVNITFSKEGDGTKVVETFDPEMQNPLDMQQAGWQSILDNFKRYAEK